MRQQQCTGSTGVPGNHWNQSRTNEGSGHVQSVSESNLVSDHTSASDQFQSNAVQSQMLSISSHAASSDDLAPASSTATESAPITPESTDGPDGTDTLVKQV